MFVEYLHLKVLLQLDAELALNQHITFIQIITHSQLVTINIALLSGFMGAVSPLCFWVSVKSYRLLLCLMFHNSKAYQESSLASGLRLLQSCWEQGPNIVCVHKTGSLL